MHVHNNTWQIDDKNTQDGKTINTLVEDVILVEWEQVLPPGRRSEEMYFEKKKTFDAQEVRGEARRGEMELKTSFCRF